MLIWIKALYVAIGVLASFVLLLSTVVAEQRSPNTTSDDINNTFARQEEFISVKIMDLPFSQSLRNPCSWDASYRGPNHETLMGSKDKFTEEFFKIVKHYSRINENILQEILGNHAIENCSNLHLGRLTDIPTLEELKEMNQEEVLNKMYLSLLVHSAYSFVVHHQVNSSDLRCSNDIQREKHLAYQSYRMALKQKTLACHVLIGMTVLGFEKEDVTPLLHEKVSDLTSCSRRALRECQIMNSARKFLQVLQNYTVDDFRKSSARLSDSISSTVSTVPTSSTTSLIIPTSPITSSSTIPTSSTIPVSSTTPASSTIPSSAISTSSTTFSSTIPTSSMSFTSSFISTSSTMLSSTTTSMPSTTSTSSIISALLTTSSSVESIASSERTTE